ncbi:MAG: exopolysaccharide biosynthesis protein [Brevundimonas sp.]
MPDYDYQSDARPFSKVIEDIGVKDDPKLYLGELVNAFGERGFGALMLFFGLLNIAIGIIPGTTTILGAPLLLMGVQLAVRQDQLWLPRWALKGSIERETYRRGVAKVLPRLQMMERLSRPRLAIMTSELSEVLIGVATVILAFILILPLWGGNLIPALVISAFGFGLMQRDGLAILLGWSAIALICIAGLVVWLAWTWVSPYLLPFWAWLNGLLPHAWSWLTGLFGVG